MASQEVSGPAAETKVKAVLPPILRFANVFGPRFPLTVAFLQVLCVAGAFFILTKIQELSTAVSATVAGLFGVILLGALTGGVRISSSGILDDLVEFVGESRCSVCFTRANKEAFFGLVPVMTFGLAPVFAYVAELRHRMDEWPMVEQVAIYCTVPVLSLLLAFLIGAVAWGPIVLVRLLCTLLKCCLRNHFEQLEAVLSCEGLSQAEVIQKLDWRFKKMKRLFMTANNSTTLPMFLSVVSAYLVSLAMVVQLAVSVRDDDSRPFILICFAALSAVTAAASSAVLYSVTSVADFYEDVAASELSHNLDIRFKVTKLFPGPAGVKLLTFFEGDCVNDLSFNFHHRPLDARVMENTMMKLFAGAVVSVVLGILR